MFFVLSKIFEFVASPTHLVLVFAGLGTVLIYTRYFIWGRRLFTLSIAIMLLMVFGPVGHLLAVPLETRFPPPPPDLAPPDGIIVLGGAADEEIGDRRGHGTFGKAAERVMTPIELKRRFPGARIVFSGGSGSLLGHSYSEADMVRSFWRNAGLDQGDAIYEEKSRNTYENAIHTRDRVKPKAGERWLLVTSAMHMPRSVGIFRRVGFPIIAYPVDYRTSGDIWTWSVPIHASQPLGLVEAAAHEWAGLIIYRLTGKTDALFPAP